MRKWSMVHGKRRMLYSRDGDLWCLSLQDYDRDKAARQARIDELRPVRPSEVSEASESLRKWNWSHGMFVKARAEKERQRRRRDAGAEPMRKAS